MGLRFVLYNFAGPDKELKDRYPRDPDDGGQRRRPDLDAGDIGALLN